MRAMEDWIGLLLPLFLSILLPPELVHWRPFQLCVALFSKPEPLAGVPLVVEISVGDWAAAGALLN